MTQRAIFPFTAIAGQEQMRTALLLHAIDPTLGGVLIRGEKGTAKSTAVRALAALLPRIAVVAGCPFGCDPADAGRACDACAARIASGDAIPTLDRTVPLVELPIGATEDRVLGSLDLETAIQSGERRFEPGLLARANRGILYVDEVNLLGDHLVDILLDAAAMGSNYVEREGVSFVHPASFLLVGTMNPEEGDLRPQLLDRFALTVEVEGLRDPAQRATVVRDRIAFEADPVGFVARRQPEEEAERALLSRARDLLPRVEVPEGMLDVIVHVCAAFGVDGMRADLAIYRAARALAAYAGRTAVDAADVRAAAALALPHRRRRQPFEAPGLDDEQLDEAIEQALEQRRNADDGGAEDHDDHRETAAPRGEPDSRDGAARAEGCKPEIEHPPQASPPRGGKREAEAPPKPPVAPSATLPLTLPSPRRTRSRRQATQGRRDTASDARHGAPAGSTLPRAEIRELALAATLRAAAPKQPARRAEGPGPALRLRRDDLRERLRRGRSGSLVLFVVDASGSMGARDRMALTKSAVVGLLLDAYRKRDRVGLIAFRNRDAELLLPPTNSVDLAERSLRTLPTGGRTPLAAGLALAETTLMRAQSDPAGRTPLLVVVSDGRANSAVGAKSPWSAALTQAERIRAHDWTVLLLDSEHGRSGTGLSRALAAALGATHMPLDSYQPAAGSRQPAAVNRQPSTVSRQPSTVAHRPPATGGEPTGLGGNNSRPRAPVSPP
jgi:magnesium chelatase subunit D